ncbi:flagellar hook-basal body protein [Pseudobutyrivibrio sp.]|uniref:flagellar hook-basal body protein n=1 Tax=Pseudobutyrivibrio sp. TaxID=2014367 RepID=UPI003864DCC7
MMRSLWSAASGMKGQQVSVDTIANNLANVNTTAYKSQSTQFKTLLYQTMQSTSTNGQGETKPTSAQVGLGTRVASINANFTQGSQLAKDSPTAMCIIGNGFFAVEDGDETHYTRNGDFTWALDDGGNKVLTTSEGYKVLDQAGRPITVPNTVEKGFTVNPDDGSIAYQNPDGTYTNTGQSIALYQFTNRVGLDKIGENLYDETAASGEPMGEWNTQGVNRSSIAQNYLEGSNVNVADEMVSLIIAQRAYEMNSKAITTSDTMLEQANNLKR